MSSLDKTFLILVLSRPLRRVHISRATLDCLGGIYETEAGRGQERNEFLRKHNIDTYLIRPALREEAEPPRARRPSYDEMTTWSAELPFGDILGMNFVRTMETFKDKSVFPRGMFKILTVSCLWLCAVDPRHLHERLFNSAAQSDCSTAVGITRSQQEDLSGHGDTEQRANEEGAHHDVHPGVQGLPHGGKGNDFTSCRGRGCLR